MPERSATDIAVDRQGKFDLYFIGLTFTVLGLAVQTAKVGVYYTADVAEILGWIALLVAAFNGMRRLEWMPEHYRLQGLKHDQEAQRFEGGKIVLTHPGAQFTVAPTGETISAREYVANAQDAITKIDKRLDELNNLSVRLSKWHRYGFLVGVVLLAVARAAPVIARFANLAGFTLR
jgi:hypothetical protein